MKKGTGLCVSLRISIIWTGITRKTIQIIIVCDYW